jgi:hypothetical protein
MDDTPIYADLFAFLAGLGFQDLSTNKFERVFEHSDSGIVLMFSMIDDMDEQSPVRTADLLSAKVHLQAKGLISESLEALIRAHGS